MTDNWRQTRSWQKKTSVIHECTNLEFTHKMHYGDVSAGARLSLDTNRDVAITENTQSHC